MCSKRNWCVIFGKCMTKFCSPIYNQLTCDLNNSINSNCVFTLLASCSAYRRAISPFFSGWQKHFDFASISLEADDKNSPDRTVDMKGFRFWLSKSWQLFRCFGSSSVSFFVNSSHSCFSERFSSSRFRSDLFSSSIFCWYMSRWRITSKFSELHSANNLELSHLYGSQFNSHAVFS